MYAGRQIERAETAIKLGLKFTSDEALELESKRLHLKRCNLFITMKIPEWVSTIKFLCFDLDGTLFRNVEEAWNAIQQQIYKTVERQETYLCRMPKFTSGKDIRLSGVLLKF